MDEQGERQTWRHRMLAIDSRTKRWLYAHSNQIAAIITGAIFVWGWVSHQAWIPFGALAVGAVSYFLGLSFGLAASVLLDIVSGIWQGVFFHQVHFPVGVSVLVGLVCTAWLGHEHKVQKTIESTRQDLTPHKDAVMPWVVSNEVRTSLAAIRFLLFPLHTEQEESPALQQATQELSRLEKIFAELEREASRAEAVTTSSGNPRPE